MPKPCKLKTFKQILVSLLNKENLLLSCFREINKKEKKEVFRSERFIFNNTFKIDKKKITKLEASKLLNTSLSTIEQLIRYGFLEQSDGLVYREDIYIYIDLIRLYEKCLCNGLITELAKQKKVYRIIDTSQSELTKSQRILLLELFISYFSRFFEVKRLVTSSNEVKLIEKDIYYLIENKKRELKQLLRLVGKKIEINEV